MDSIHQLLWPHGHFLGVTWSAWKAIGWAGNAIFASRVFVQWYSTEKKRQVHVPVAFWWLSLTGSLILLSYALYRRDSVFILAYAINWAPYIRNLMIHYRHERSHRPCPECGVMSPPSALFCSQCGSRLASPAPAGKC